MYVGIKASIPAIALTFTIFSIPVPAATGQERAFDEIVFIDHMNLRYVEGVEEARQEGEQAKRNIDEALKHGATSYLFFAKEGMEAMLSYDFEVPGIGSIGRQAFADSSEHRRTAEFMRAALADVLAYAKAKNIRLFYHSNQFIFPKEVLEVIKPATWGTAVCPGRDATWALYRGKIDEFFRLFPDTAGLQITGDETQVSVLACECDQCRDMDFVERVNRLMTETAAVAARYGKDVQMRTWQRMGELGNPADMGKGIPANVAFSIKNTSGDFRLLNDMDEEFLDAAAPERLIVEFDAWREYDGHNYFPCYMGDKWGPRLKWMHDKGIRRIAVRLNWNSNKNPIFERPWGNYVNLFTFLALAKDPSRDLDAILREFVDTFYPAEARKPAFELYKFSPEFQKIIYYIKGEYVANHSRVQDDDAEGNLEELQEDGLLIRPEDFDGRRREIEAVCNKAEGLVNRLGDGVAEVWKTDLCHGIAVERYVALGTADKLEAIFWRRKVKPERAAKAKLAAVEERITTRLREWKAWDPESYTAMNAQDMSDDSKL